MNQINTLVNQARECVKEADQAQARYDRYLEARIAKGIKFEQLEVYKAMIAETRADAASLMAQATALVMAGE